MKLVQWKLQFQPPMSKECTTGYPQFDGNCVPRSIICLSKLDLQFTHRPRHTTVCPFHICITCPMHRHLESTEKMSEREIQFRVCQAASEQLVIVPSQK